MAIYPCAVGAHRYPQPQQSAYFSRLLGRDVHTRRARLCPTHFRAFAVLVEARMENVTETASSSMTCQICGVPRETSCFVRLYPAKGEEAVFALDLCEEHAWGLTNDLGTDAWDLLSRG